MPFEDVAQLADIPAGRGLCVTIRGIEVGLFQVGERVYAMENRCPHSGEPLSEGLLTGCIILCTAHGWEFDVTTGHNRHDDDGFPIPCFAVKVENGTIRVDLDDPINLRRRARQGGTP